MESKPDTVLSTGNCIMGKPEWTTSDHAIISGEVPSQIRRRKLLVTDWETWEEFGENEDKDATY